MDCLIGVFFVIFHPQGGPLIWGNFDSPTESSMPMIHPPCNMKYFLPFQSNAYFLIKVKTNWRTWFMAIKYFLNYGNYI